MTFVAEFSQVLLFLLGVFLMIVILLQRGRGGGLAGAFGGLGGQSAFGTKAGDVFTKITVVIAVLWVVVSGGSGFFLRAAADAPSEGLQTEEEIEASSALDDEDPIPGAGPLIPDNNSPPEFPPAGSAEDPGDPGAASPDSDSDSPDSDSSPDESDTTEPTESDSPETTDDGDSETPESSEETDAESPTTDADVSDESSTENE